MVEPLWMPSGRAAVVTSTDKSMPAAPANSGGCGCSDADAPQLSRMLDKRLVASPEVIQSCRAWVESAELRSAR